MIGKKKKLSLLDVLISLPADPKGIMWHLLQERRRPPYLLLSLICLALVLLGPLLYYEHYYGLPLGDKNLWLSALLTVVLTLLFSTLLISVLFRITLLAVREIKILGGIIYSLLGLIPLMLAFYLGNFIASGELSIISLFITAKLPANDWFAQLFPICTVCGGLLVLFLLVHAVRAMTNSTLSSALLMTSLTLPVFLGAFTTALTISDAVFDGLASEAFLHIRLILL